MCTVICVALDFHKWNSVDLTTRKSFSFKVKVNVDNCAPAQLAFGAHVGGGTCTVNAEKSTDVKRSKKSNTCAPTNAPTTAPTGSPTGAPVAPPAFPGFCNGNGNCKQAGDLCAASITGCNGQTGDFDTCTDTLVISPTVGLCSLCAGGQPEIQCTADSSGSCLGTDGSLTDCDLGPSPNQQGLCYCNNGF
jgi:hypothetical protein